MKILILGVIHSTNFGDPILTECVRRLVQKKVPDAEIMLGDLNGGDPVPDIGHISYAGSSVSMEKIPSVQKLKLGQLKYNVRTQVTKCGIWDQEYRLLYRNLQYILPSVRKMLNWKPDLVVFAGGQILGDWYGLQTAEIIRLLREQTTSAVFISCGTGPYYSMNITQKLLEALNSPFIRFISVRDGIDRLRRQAIRKPLYDTGDAALWAGRLFACRQKAAGTRQAIGIGVIYSGTTPVRKELLFLKHLTSFLNQNGIPWRFFGNGSAEDRAIAEKALERCVPSEKDRKTHMAQWPEKPEDLIHLESGFRGIISFRLHSHIIAASLGVPSVAIEWDDKLPEFFRKINAAERCLDLNATPEQVWKTFLQAEQEGYNKQKIDGYRRQVSDLLDKALDPYR